MATALYRRYRPESFAEVIGQDHVTTPLRRALRAGRVGHAYLFSGPRGCGKTTSARILARCLNCAEGPTDVPCGQCDSCRDLANGGSGSLDVVEIDAASHGGVDDARELRERASFAPVRDRYKVFIIDEAHMVTSAGFNAMLKLVEEPPEHVKFVFATTEPDKVIGTIRSRTHHYPFRLIPPQVLGPYLDEVCAAEGVQVGEGVMPLVVRAGGGSARDSMSVLDQLMAGAAEDGLDFPTAIALLGFTDTALLDSAVTAVAQRDAAALYSAVEHVLATGHEPRRFVEDLLERMRDLIVLAAVPDRGADLLPQVPADELESMRSQAAMFAPADLSQCGDLVHETLSTMSGATSPRLHLELLAARLVLRDERAALAAADGPAPAADPRGGAPVARRGQPGGQPAGAPAQGGSTGASGAREEARRIAQEKVEASRQARSGRSGAPAAEAAGPGPTNPAAPAQSGSAAPASTGPADPAERGSAAPAASAAAATEPVRWGDSAPQNAPTRPAASEAAPQRAPAQQPSAQQGSPAQPSAPSVPVQQPPAEQPPAEQPPAEQPPAPQSAAQQSSAPQSAPSGAAASSGGLDADEVRTHWSAILDELQQIRRPSWALISQNGHVHAAHGSTLVIGFRTDGLINAFHRGTAAQNLADAVRRIMHLDVTIEAVVGEDPGPGGGGGQSSGGPAGGGQSSGGPAGGGLISGGPAGGAPSRDASGPGAPAEGAPAGSGPGAHGASGAPARSHEQDGQNTAARAESTPASAEGGPRGQEARVRWGDAVSAMAPTAPSAAPSPAPGPAPAQQDSEPLSAGQRASERAMRAAARAAQSSHPGAGPDRGQDFPPEPDDDFPPEPDDPFPPDPQDDHRSGPRDAQPVPSTRGGGWSAGGAEQPGAGPTGPGAGAPAAADSPAASSGASASGALSAPAPAPATTGEIPVVDDEGRDSLAPGEPRTFGQSALRRAIAEGRLVHSRPAQPSVAGTAQPEAQPGAQSESPSWGDAATSAATASDASTALDTPDAPDAPAAPDVARSGESGWSADGAGSSAAERAAASWGTAATVSAPAVSAPAASAPVQPAPSSAPSSASSGPSAGQSGASAAPSAPRSGAALAREAAHASRGAGQRLANRLGGAEEQAKDVDPTGGATRDDEDAVVATRNGREVVEKLLGGKVLEIIDENRAY